MKYIEYDKNQLEKLPNGDVSLAMFLATGGKTEENDVSSDETRSNEETGGPSLLR